MLFYAVYTSCNKIIPQIIAVASTQEALDELFSQGTETKLSELIVYEEVNDETQETDTVPYVVSNVCDEHVVSYCITEEQISTFMGKSFSNDVKCPCSQHVISVFRTDAEIVDFNKVFDSLNII